MKLCQPQYLIFVLVIVSMASGAAHAMRDPLGTVLMPGPVSSPAYQPELERPVGARRVARPHLQYTDGMSLYQYAKSNPVAHLDPTGMATQTGSIDTASRSGIAGGTISWSLEWRCDGQYQPLYASAVVTRNSGSLPFGDIEIAAIVGIGANETASLATRLVEQKNCPFGQCGEIKVLEISAINRVYHSILLGITLGGYGVEVPLARELHREYAGSQTIELRCCIDNPA